MKYFLLSGLALFLCLPSFGAQPLKGQQVSDVAELANVPRARNVVFNVFCRYRSDGAPRKCFAASRFEKKVTLRGYETLDNSEYPQNPAFEVECDNETIFNDGGRRFTDKKGTRIQAQSGPYPAILLPPDALYEGPHYANSHLELRDKTLKGSCFIYNGNP